MLSFQDRINYLDKILNLVSDNEQVKFYVISFIHYIGVLILYIWFLLTKSFKIFIILFIVIVFQLILNIIDDGCILMKLERKYVGKDWYGGYNGLEYLGIELDKKVVENAYTILMISIGAAFIYRLWRWK